MASRDGDLPDRLLRIGDSERDAAAASLGEHYAAGRIDQSEFDERLASVYAARTHEDLRGMFRDLPDPWPVGLRPVPVGRPAWRLPAPPVLPVLVMFVLFIAVSVHVGAPVFLLPVLGMWLWRRRGHRPTGGSRL